MTGCDTVSNRCPATGIRLPRVPPVSGVWRLPRTWRMDPDASRRNLTSTIAAVNALDAPGVALATRENMRRLLTEMAVTHSPEYAVDSTERGGVSVSATKRGAAFSVECAPNDIVYCFVAIDGNPRRAKHYQMDGLPDAFMTRALEDFAGGP